MSMSYRAFEGQAILTGMIHKRNPNRATEFAAVATALGTDTTTHDKTIQNPPAALQIGAGKTRLTNDLNLLVNRGKAGNLANAAMAQAINAAIDISGKPQVVDIPYVSGPTAQGGTLNCTKGNWTGQPSSYAYQWKRDGVTIAGATSASYVTQVADKTHLVGCVVTATNVQGATAAPISNQIGIV